MVFRRDVCNNCGINSWKKIDRYNNERRCTKCGLVQVHTGLLNWGVILNDGTLFECYQGSVHKRLI